MSEISKQEVEKFKLAVVDPNIPHLYFNGFANAQGNSDITVLLQLNLVPVGTLSLSYTIAKTLSQKLGEIVSELEEASGNTIMTTDDVTKFMSKG